MQTENKRTTCNQFLSAVVLPVQHVASLRTLSFDASVYEKDCETAMTHDSFKLLFHLPIYLFLSLVHIADSRHFLVL